MVGACGGPVVWDDFGFCCRLGLAALFRADVDVAFCDLSRGYGRAFAGDFTLIGRVKGIEARAET